MENQQLWEAIYAYNRQVKRDRQRGKKLDEIRLLTEKLSHTPSLQELADFLQNLRQLLG